MDDIAKLQTTLRTLRSGLRRADWQHASAVHSARIGGLLRAAAAVVVNYHGRQRTPGGWTLCASADDAVVAALRVVRRNRSRTTRDLDDLVVVLEVLAPALVDPVKLDHLTRRREVEIARQEAPA